MFHILTSIFKNRESQRPHNSWKVRTYMFLLQFLHADDIHRHPPFHCNQLATNADAHCDHRQIRYNISSNRSSFCVIFSSYFLPLIEISSSAALRRRRIANLLCPMKEYHWFSSNFVETESRWKFDFNRVIHRWERKTLENYTIEIDHLRAGV